MKRINFNLLLTIIIMGMVIFILEKFFRPIFSPIISGFSNVFKLRTDWTSHTDYVNKVYPKIYKFLGNAEQTLIILAQSILETGWGESRISKEDQNIFGIKAGSGEANIYWDGSIDNGYRKYLSIEGCIGDYIRLLKTRYTEAWRVLRELQYSNSELKAKSYYSSLKIYGYAEDNEYVDKCMQIWNELKEGGY